MDSSKPDDPDRPPGPNAHPPIPSRSSTSHVHSHGGDPTKALGASTNLLTPGQILGNRYRIVALLGRGGMGEVWQAYDLKLQVDVALKSIRAERFPGEQGIELLRREVRSAREVMSPNVCRIFDLVDEEGQEFVSMEYVDGETLLEVLRGRGPLQLQEATRLASQFLAGLEAIHQAGLVHRDVKPENIMITRTGRVVLMDFGVAKGVAEDHRGTIAGTPAYMAPEQLLGEALNARADIFAAGVVLAEMIAPRGVKDRESRESIWHAVRQTPVQLFDGPWRGVLERAVAVERARRYESARALARALEEVTLRAEGAEDKHPYPGLESFTEADAEFFFGREVEVETVWKKLQRANLLAIIGPSGAGKSSFVQAGLIPAKPTEWEYVLLRPGSSPFVALAQALVPKFAGDTEAMQQLVQAENVEPLVAVLDRWRSRHPQALVVVDQFEELFTLCRPEAQARFADLLGHLAVEADVHVLLVMRDDFLFRCHEHPMLAPIFSELTPLGPPTGSALRRALVQPAQLCGYRFEDESLADEMLAAIEGERGALPMLAFAAARLWEQRDRETGLLTREAYERIGGVSGALAQHAEATLERIGSQRQPVVREIFRNLVTAQGTRAVADVEELLSVFDDGNPAREVLGELVNARLLTSFEVPETHNQGHEKHRVEIVHESLLSAWPRLVHWQTQDIEGAQLRDQLRQATQLWKERSKSQDLLWTGNAYREFAVWRERYPGGLTTTEEEFARAMTNRAAFQRRRRRIALAGAFAILCGVLLVTAWSLRAEKVARLGAEAGKLVALGRQELDENPSGALAYAIAALGLVDNPPNRFFALEALSRGPMALTMPYPSPDGALNLDFSPDGKRLAVNGFGGLYAFSDDGSHSVILQRGGGRSFMAPEFAPDGDRVVYPDPDDRGLTRIWSLSQGKEVRTFRIPEGYTVPLVRGGRLLLRTNVSQSPPTSTIRTWRFDESEPTLVSTLNHAGWEGHDIDRSGRFKAYTKERGVYVGPLEDPDGSRARLLGEHPVKAAELAFDSAGKQIASADTSGEIRIWSVAGDAGTPIRVLHGAKPVRNIQFDPTGTMVAAVCGGKQIICVWDLHGPRNAEPARLRITGENSMPIEGSTGHPLQFRFDPTGRWLAAAYFQNIVFWPVHRLDSYVLPSGLGQFTADGQLVLYSGLAYSTGLRVQDLEGGSPRDLWKAEPGVGVKAFFDPRGKFMAVSADSRKGSFLVSLPDGRLRKLPDSDPKYLMAFSTDGRFLAGTRIEDDEPEIAVWDLEAWTARVLDGSKGIRTLALTFAEDGRLFTGDAEGIVRQWDIGGGSSTIVHKSDLSVIGLAFTGDPRFLLAVESSWTFDPTYVGFVTRLDLKNHTSSRMASHGNKVSHLALDSARTLVVTSSYQGPVRVGPISGEESHVLVMRARTSLPAYYPVAISPDGRWIVVESDGEESEPVISLFRRPEGEPLHTLPHDELLRRLRALTNLRVVPDKASLTGYRLDRDPFPGWRAVPTS